MNTIKTKSKYGGKGNAPKPRPVSEGKHIELFVKDFYAKYGKIMTKLAFE